MIARALYWSEYHTTPSTSQRGVMKAVDSCGIAGTQPRHHVGLGSKKVARVRLFDSLDLRNLYLRLTLDVVSISLLHRNCDAPDTSGNPALSNGAHLYLTLPVAHNACTCH